MTRLTDILRRGPFTLLMLAALIVAGIYGQTHLGLLDTGVHRAVGHSPRLMFDGHLHRPFTSLFFTAGGWRFYCSLLMFAAAVGWVESVYGTRRALLTFFGIHLATLLLSAIAIAVPLSWLETHRGELLFDACDVGPSAGYYGCLGLVIAGLGSRLRNIIVAAVTLTLFLRLGWSTMHLSEEGRMMSADLAHLVAFPVGLLSHRLLRSTRNLQRDKT